MTVIILHISMLMESFDSLKLNQTYRDETLKNSKLHYNSGGYTL